MVLVSSKSVRQLGFLDNSSLQVPIQTQVDLSGISDEAIFIFAWAVYGVLCQTIGVFGIVTNIINIICFVKQDFKDSINISLIGLAISDLGCLITLVGLNVMYNPSVLAADLSFEPKEVCYFIFGIPHISFSRVSSWITALITLERCLCIVMPLKIKSFVTPRKTFIIVISIHIFLQFSTSPLYAVNRLGMTFSQLRNKTLLGRISLGDRENVESISFMINNFVLPVIAFIVIVICTIILAIKLRNASEWRKKATTPKQTDRVSSRNQKVAKMVVMMSALFIVCFAPLCITLLAVAFEPELFLGGKYLKIAVVLGGLGFVLESVNSSANIFIYYHMSSKYRESLHRIFSLK